MPFACQERGSSFFDSAAEYLLLQQTCQDLVPDSSAGFARVVARYEAEGPACIAAIRSMPEVSEALEQDDLRLFISDFKSGKLSPDMVKRVEGNCRSIEKQDDEHRALERSVREAVPSWPSPGG